MWGSDHKIGWASKNWCFLIGVLEKTFESPLDSKEIKPVNPKGNQPRLLIGRTGAEAEAPILWQNDAKRWLTGKDPDAGKDWRQNSTGQQRIRWLDTIIDSIDMSLNKLWEIVKEREAWHAAIHRVTKSWLDRPEWLNNNNNCMSSTVIQTIQIIPYLIITLKHAMEEHISTSGKVAISFLHSYT